jgi:hypothetical protein
MSTPAEYLNARRIAKVSADKSKTIMAVLVRVE